MPRSEDDRAPEQNASGLRMPEQGPLLENPSDVQTPDQGPMSDWTQRLLSRLPGSYWLGFPLVIIVMMTLSILYRLTAGDPVDMPRGWALLRQWYIWLDILLATITGFLWSANLYLHRGLQRDLKSLRPTLKLSDNEFNQEVRQISCAQPNALLLAGLAGAMALASMPLLDPRFWTFKQPDFLSLDMLFYLGRQVLVGWLAGHTILNEVRGTQGIARLGGSHARIDLLDTNPLTAFSSKGLRSATTWLVCSSLVSLFWLWDAVAVSIGPIVLMVLILSLVVFLSPLVPLRRAILTEKTKRLDLLRNAIKSEQDPLSEDGRDASPRYANLVANYRLVEDVREWPIETPTLLRFGLFAVLGLGSWLGGALVERLLEWFIR